MISPSTESKCARPTCQSSVRNLTCWVALSHTHFVEIIKSLPRPVTVVFERRIRDPAPSGQPAGLEEIANAGARGGPPPGGPPLPAGTRGGPPPGGPPPQTPNGPPIGPSSGSVGGPPAGPPPGSPDEPPPESPSLQSDPEPLSDPSAGSAAPWEEAEFFNHTGKQKIAFQFQKGPLGIEFKVSSLKRWCCAVLETDMCPSLQYACLSGLWNAIQE